MKMMTTNDRTTTPVAALPPELFANESASQRLSEHLSNMREGFDQVLRTPFMKDYTDEEALSAFDEFYNDNKHVGVNDELEKLEMKNRENYSPRSIAKPWSERREGFLERFKPYSGSGDPTDLSKRRLINGDLRPLEKLKASKHLKRNTAASLPFMEKKGLVLSYVVENFDKLDRNYPYVTYTRTQEKGKTRDILGASIIAALWEAMYFFPYMESQKKLPYRSSLNGPEAVATSLTRMYRLAERDGLILVSIDFSKYDISNKPPLIEEFKRFVQNRFVRSESEQISELIANAISCGAITPDGLEDGWMSNPSGWLFTLECNSDVQMLISEGVLGMTDELRNITGDDGAYAVPSSEVDNLFKQFESFGLQVNIDKTDVADDHWVYLQNLYHPDYNSLGELVPVYPLYRAFLRLRFMERFATFAKYDINGSEWFTFREISIMENCKHHPLFKEFVAWVAKHFKFEYKLKSLSKFVKHAEDTKGAVGIINSQYSDNLTGFESFSTVKLLRELGEI
jgi:hypothetical protein